MSSVSTITELNNIVFSSETKLVSFDCFDTLLLWPYEPWVLVEIAAEHSNLPLSIYKRIRNWNHGWWKNIEKTKENAYINNVNSQKLKSEEIEFDKSVITPRTFMVNLLKNLVNEGKEVIITTDMYLSEKNIDDLLKLNGITGYSKIYLSKNGKSKGNGKLFEEIIEDYKSIYKPENIVHIGDNEDSDYNIPCRYGIKSVHIEKPLDIFKKSLMGKKYVPTSNGDRILIGIMANKLYDNPFNKIEGSIQKLGIMIGSLITSFCLWMEQLAKIQGINKIYLIMSDGYLIEKVLDAFSQNYKCISHELLYLSRLTRSPDILLKYGITGDIKQIKYYLSPEMFLINKRKECLITINKIKKTGIIEETDITFLNNNLDQNYLKKASSDLKEYLKSLNIDNSSALFDGSFNATALQFLKEYTTYSIKGEFQLVGSPKNDNVWNYIQNRQLNISSKIIDLDPCIKTPQRKVDSVQCTNYGILLKMHGYERPNITAAIIQHFSIDIAHTLSNLFKNYLENLTFSSGTFWNPIMMLWESSTLEDKNIIENFEKSIITKEDQEVAIKIFENNQYNDLMAEYYLYQLYLSKNDSLNAYHYLEKSSSKGILLAEKEFIDYVLSHNLSKYYASTITYILELQTIDPAYYGRLGRLYKYGKGLPQDYEQAIKYYRKAANEGIIWAINELFDLLFELNSPKYHSELEELIKEIVKSKDKSAIDRRTRYIERYGDNL